MARKKKQTTGTEPTGSILDYLGIPDDVNKKAEPAAQPDVRELLSRIDAMGKTVEEQKAHISRLESRPITVNAPTQTTHQGTRLQDIRFDPTGMPDPITHKAEFDTELARRTNAVAMAQAAAVREELTTQINAERAAQSLWGLFLDEYPEWAEHRDLVGVVAERVNGRGIDALTQPQAFVKAVGDEMAEKYGLLVTGKAGDGDSDTDGEGDEPPKPTDIMALRRAGKLNPFDRQEDDDDEGRTGGIFGGLESGHQPSKGGKPAPGDFVKDLQDVQRKLGVY